MKLKKTNKTLIPCCILLEPETKSLLKSVQLEIQRKSGSYISVSRLVELAVLAFVKKRRYGRGGDVRP